MPLGLTSTPPARGHRLMSTSEWLLAVALQVRRLWYRDSVYVAERKEKNCACVRVCLFVCGWVGGWVGWWVCWLCGGRTHVSNIPLASCLMFSLFCWYALTSCFTFWTSRRPGLMSRVSGGVLWDCAGADDPYSPWAMLLGFYLCA